MNDIHISFVCIFLVSYLLGSIPFGFILGRLGGYGDIRAQGSGNIGATNALRLGGIKLGIGTLFFDSLKGLGAVYLVKKGVYGGGMDLAIGSLVSACSAVVGHIFPIWLRFKGGKGVATILGVLLGLSFPLGLAVLVSWGIILRISSYSSLASLGAALLIPFYALYFLGGIQAGGLAFLSFLILYRHKENLRRLGTGQEPKVQWKGSSTPPQSSS